MPHQDIRPPKMVTKKPRTLVFQQSMALWALFAAALAMLFFIRRAIRKGNPEIVNGTNTATAMIGSPE
jgi:hypothetical protein